MKKKSYIIDNKMLMSEWNYEKNGNLKPEQITSGSHKIVWWKCKKNHEYEMSVKQKTYGQTCPYCCNRRVLVGYNDLQTTNPNIAKEWHPTKNGNLTSQQVTHGSGKKVWWQCSKCGYEWKTSVLNRTKGRNCPLCSNKVVVYGKNDLATTHPEIAKEWHPTKNNNLKPEQFSHGSREKIWWKCPFGHEYESTIANRTNGTNCPICNIGRQTSFAEQAVFYYVKKLYPDAINRYKADFLERMELDIYIPSIRYAIEYDGAPWHSKGIKGKLERDRKKYNICCEHNIKLIRLSEKMSDIGSDVADYQFNTDNLHKPKNLEFMIKEILKQLDFSLKHLKFIYGINIEKDRIKILENMNVIKKKNSFEDQFPEIAKEWHNTKNGKLLPKMFMSGSKVKVWWKCSVCGYEYFMSIYHRAKRKQGCKKCGIKRIKQKQSVPVEMIDINTNKVIKIFESMFEASTQMKITKSNICMACKGQRQTAGGYRWSYVKEKD